MTMLIEVDREERTSGVGCRPRPRPSIEHEVRAHPLERQRESPESGRAVVGATRGAAAAGEPEREWPWLLSAGFAAFLVVVLFGLFGSAAPPAGGGAPGSVGPGDTREIGSDRAQPAGEVGPGLR